MRAHVNRALPYFKLSHVTYILLLCDLWQRWAVGRLFARVRTPPSLSVAFSSSPHFPDRNTNNLVSFKRRYEQGIANDLRAGFMISG